MYNGFINILKPTGMTSNDLVGKMKYLTRKYKGEKVKYGHTGTLDPNAAGVMLVCVGRGTKFSQYVMDKKKTYIGIITLGKTTDTLDTYGKVEAEQTPCVKTMEQIQSVLDKYKGESSQIPPKFSAIKINGQKLYDLARKGHEVPEIKPRKINITKLELIEYKHPNITIEVECSAGTYIRSLAQDIGEDLGELAHLSLLIRTQVENHAIEQSHTVEEIEKIMAEDKFEDIIIPVDKALEKYPNLILKSEYEKAYLNGVRILENGIATKIKKDILNLKQKVYNEDGQFLGIGNLTINEDANFVLKSETQR
ncbi:MAG: tRNA pseudouridine(55) synthase TruB [Proteocatella sp.]